MFPQNISQSPLLHASLSYHAYSMHSSHLLQKLDISKLQSFGLLFNRWHPKKVTSIICDNSWDPEGSVILCDAELFLLHVLICNLTSLNWQRPRASLLRVHLHYVRTKYCTFRTVQLRRLDWGMYVNTNGSSGQSCTSNTKYFLSDPLID
jgi:hypothetical protein